MTKPTVVFLTALLGLPSVCWPQCNGRIGQPTQVGSAGGTNECPTVHNTSRYATYKGDGEMECNQAGIAGVGKQSGTPPVTVYAQGTCLCSYIGETVFAYLGDSATGMVVEADWNDGVEQNQTCQFPQRISQNNDPRISDCGSEFCCSLGSVCSGFWQGPPWCDCRSSPLFLVFEGRWDNALTSGERGVPFAIQPGPRKVLVAWTHADSDRVGLLVRDRNGNGTIDDGSELYGSETPQPTPRGPQRHGFSALAAEDYDQNGWIDGRDPAYREMFVWFDRNHNGVSEPEELIALAASGVKAIAVRYRSLGQQDRHGNIFAFESDMVIVVGERPRTSRVYDVYPRTAVISERESARRAP